MPTPNFTSGQLTTVQPITIGPGVKMVKFAASFNGTQSTTDVISPFTSVVDANAKCVTTNTVSATRADDVLLTNTMGGSGQITLIAASTNNFDITVPTILRFSRAGTNNQDIIVTVFGN